MPVLRELISLSSELVTAVKEHDRDRLEQLLAAEFTLNGAAGELDREALLEAASGPYEIDDFGYEEIDAATPRCSSPATGRPPVSTGATSRIACTSRTSGSGATAAGRSCAGTPRSRAADAIRLM